MEVGVDEKQMTRLARREIRFPVRTKTGHYYEASVKILARDECEEGRTPAECMELRQTEMESIVEDFKKGISRRRKPHPLSGSGKPVP